MIIENSSHTFGKAVTCSQRMQSRSILHSYLRAQPVVELPYYNFGKINITGGARRVRRDKLKASNLSVIQRDRKLSDLVVILSLRPNPRLPPTHLGSFKNK